MGTSYVELNGSKFKLDIRGSGPPLVLLHAGIADMRMWEPQLESFAEHFTVIRYDLRGFGETPPAKVEYSHHSDLALLLDHMKIDQAHLLGCSLGGTAVLDCALEHPGRAKSLVLVACSPSGFEVLGDPPAEWQQAVKAFNAGDFESAAEWEVALWVDGPHRGPEQVDPAVRDLVREMNAIALANEAKELGSSKPLDPPAAARLGQIDIPVLIVVGDLDNPHIMRAGEQMSNEIPAAKLAVIEGTAHLPSMERPAEFSQIVLEFLQRASGA